MSQAGACSPSTGLGTSFVWASSVLPSISTKSVGNGGRELKSPVEAYIFRVHSSLVATRQQLQMRLRSLNGMPVCTYPGDMELVSVNQSQKLEFVNLEPYHTLRRLIYVKLFLKLNTDTVCTRIVQYSYPRGDN